MAKTIKIIVAIASLLTFLGCLGFAFWALFVSSMGLEPKILTTVVCTTLAGFMALFLRNDYYYFFEKKDEPTKPV